MSDILVTGATGLIGQRLMCALGVEGGAYGVAHKQQNDRIPGVDWITADLTDPLTLDRLPAGVKSVVHLAQSSHFRDFPDQAMDVFGVNVAATARLLDWCVKTGVKRFVLASSGGIYGSGDRGFSEDDVVGGGSPLGYYLASKQCAELLAESYADQLTVTTLRFFFVYGPEQRRSMLIPRLVESVLTERAIALQGEDGLTINPIHVDDAVAAITRSLSLTDSHKINVAGPEILSLRQIGDTIGELTGRAPCYEVDSSAKPSQIVGDIRKMKRLLGSPTISFSAGVAEVCAALKPKNTQPGT